MLVGNIGACRPGHTRALPGLFRIIRTHIMRTGREDTYIACAQTYVTEWLPWLHGLLWRKQQENYFSDTNISYETSVTTMWLKQPIFLLVWAI